MRTVVSVFGVKPQRIGGTETFARELSQQLNARSWQSVLCFLSEPSAEVREFLELPNTQLRVLPNSTNGNRIARRRLRGILDEFHPQILHLHFVGFLNLFGWDAWLKSVNQVFFTDHHSRPTGYSKQRAPLWKRSAARLINYPLTKAFCVSKYGYECMSALDLLPGKRFEMIYNGVDLSRINFEPSRARDFRQRFSIPDDRQIVTQVSWIISEKGIADFLEMARLVLLETGNVQFVLVGDGDQRAEYTKAASDMGIGDHVTWTGMVEDPFGEGVFAAADVVCQFSRWEEVFGWMIAEAMAHRKPIVATRVGGIPELVAEGESGFLVDRGDAAAMAKRVLTLLNDAKLRNSFGRTGEEIVRQKFDLQSNVSKLVASYNLAAFQFEPQPNVNRLQESLF
jgi:glycosyltransferase involved in cell wall biosynthesis